MDRDGSEEKQVLTVNGTDVSQREFEAAMALERVSVIHEFQTKYSAEYNSDFWGKSFGGTTPAETLRTRALERCINIKLQQTAAVQAGILKESDISYSGFLSMLEEENKRRKEAVDNGEIIYGPKKYEEEEFFKYTFNNMVIRLKEKLVETELKHTPEEVAAYYRDHQSTLYKKPTYIRAKKLVVTADPDTQAKARGLIEQAKLDAERLKSLEQAAVKKGGTVELSEQVFDETTERGDHRYASELLEAAKQLNPGEISGVIPIQGGFALLQSLERKEEGAYPIREVEEDIMNRLTAQKYERWLSGQRDSADIHINTKAYNQILIEP